MAMIGVLGDAKGGELDKLGRFKTALLANGVTAVEKLPYGLRREMMISLAAEHAVPILHDGQFEIDVGRGVIGCIRHVCAPCGIEMDTCSILLPASVYSRAWILLF